MDIKRFIANQRKQSKKQTYSSIKKNHNLEYLRVMAETSFLASNSPLLARYYCISHDIHNHPTCKSCGTDTKWQRLWDVGYQTYCSTRCKNLDPNQQSAAKRGMLKKYGVYNISQVPGIHEKKQNTWLRNYGVDHPAKSDEIKEKTKQTNLDRYGVAHAMKLDIYQEKAKRTNNDRYGYDYVQQVPQIKAKSVKSFNDKYDRDNYTQQHIPLNVLSKLNDAAWMTSKHISDRVSLVGIGRELGVWDTTIKRYMDKHGIETYNYAISAGELELSDFLVGLGIHSIRNDRVVISPYELDFFIPSKQIAIEYNGIHWHSECFKTNRNYHKNKTDMCAALGIQLIHIFEDDWVNNTQVIKQMLCVKLGEDVRPSVYARNTVIRSVTNGERDVFLDLHHIQGRGRGSVVYGLFNNNELVSVIVFIKQNHGVYELNRFASSCSVVGGFSKLLTHFKRNIDWNRIVTFADVTISDGDLYDQTGFSVDGIIPPDYKYVINGKRIHKFNFRHKQLAKKLDIYDDSLSEWQNCKNNNIFRIWDCGKKRYVLDKFS